MANQVRSAVKSVVAEEFQPDVEDKHDMLRSFVRHGLAQEDLEPEVLLQMYGFCRSVGYEN